MKKLNVDERGHDVSKTVRNGPKSPLLPLPGLGYLGSAWVLPLGKLDCSPVLARCVGTAVGEFTPKNNLIVRWDSALQIDGLG